MMISRRFRHLLLPALAAALVAGCSSSRKSTYPVAHANVAHKLALGTVVDVRDVVIDGHSSMLGIGGGAAVGAAIGTAAMGMPEDYGDYTRTGIVAAATGVVGAVAGQAIEKKLTQKHAQELTIRMESGETVIIVQERRDPPFTFQDKVQVYTTAYGNSRVFHSNEDPFVDPETNAYLVGGEPAAAEAEAEPSAEDEPIAW